MITDRNKYSIVSLFAGCGGLDYGFSDDFFTFKYAADNDPAAIACYKHNLHKSAECIDVTTDDFRKRLIDLGECDVVLGGFPCQGFSKSGPKKYDDPRNRLYKSMIETVTRLQPKIFIAENVDGMAQNYNGAYVNKIVKDFERCHPPYKVFHSILNAINFGIPQYRRRIFFIGLKKGCGDNFSWPKPSHYGGSRNGEFKISGEPSAQLTFNDLSNGIIQLSPPSTMKDAIGDLLSNRHDVPDQHFINKLRPKDIHIMEKIKEGQKLCNVRFANSSIYTWQIPKAFGKTSSKEKIILKTIGKNRRKKIYGNIPNGNPLPIEEISRLANLDIDKTELTSLVKRNFLKVIDKKYDLKGAMFCSGLYKRPNWNEPSPTVITFFHGPRYFLHPKENRPFTIRECARLQSFPDSFVFSKSGIKDIDAYRLIGNAVPPKLSEVIAKSVIETLRKV